MNAPSAKKPYGFVAYIDESGDVGSLPKVEDLDFGAPTSPPIRQPLADDPTQRTLGTVIVVDAEGNAVAVTEVEFSEITMQVLLGTVLVEERTQNPRFSRQVVSRFG